MRHLLRQSVGRGRQTTEPRQPSFVRAKSRPPNPGFQNDGRQSTFLRSTHTLRAQQFLSIRNISRNTAPPVLFLAPVCSGTMGRNFTRRPFVDRARNRRVTDDFVSPQLSPQLWGAYPKARNGARAGCTRPWRRKPLRFGPWGHQARPALAKPMGCTIWSSHAHSLTAGTAESDEESLGVSICRGRLQPGRAEARCRSKQ